MILKLEKTQLVNVEPSEENNQATTETVRHTVEISFNSLKEIEDFSKSEYCLRNFPKPDYTYTIIP